MKKKDKTYLYWIVGVVALILLIIILNNQGKNSDNSYNIQKIILTFDESEVSFFNEVGDLIHNGGYIEISPGFKHKYPLIIKSNKPNICVEYSNQLLDEVKLLKDNYQVKVSDDYAVQSKEYKVSCFKITEKEAELYVSSAWNINKKEQNMIISFWN